MGVAPKRTRRPSKGDPRRGISRARKCVLIAILVIVVLLAFYGYNQRKKREFDDPIFNVQNGGRAQSGELAADKLMYQLRDILSSNKEAAKSAVAIDTFFRFAIVKRGGETRNWDVNLTKNPPVVALKISDKPKPDLVVTMSDGDFDDIVNGRLSAETAYFDGRLEVDGSIMTALKLKELFAIVQRKQ